MDGDPNDEGDRRRHPEHASGAPPGPSCAPGEPAPEAIAPDGVEVADGRSLRDKLT
jgi:hypothetical protein